MGTYMHGWIEVKAEFYDEWEALIGIDPSSFYLKYSASELVNRLSAISTRGMPEDASEVVKRDWNPNYYTSPEWVNWDDVWKIDADGLTRPWWLLVEMVSLFRSENNGEFRLVFWGV